MLQEKSVTSPLSFDRLVPGHLVHRSQLNDVLVTDTQLAESSDTFLCGVQWPRNHVLFGRGPGIDSALVAETVRQVTTHVAHAHYDVPLDYQFLMSRLQVSVPRVSHRTDSAYLTVTVNLHDIRRNKASLLSFVSRIIIRDDRGIVAEGAGYARLVSRAAYERTRQVPGLATRQQIKVDKVPAREVGVLEEDLVLISPTQSRHRFQLQANPDVAAYFDHRLDHIPGMALFEAGRQAVRHLAQQPHNDFAHVDIQFNRLIDIGLESFVDVALTDVRGSDTTATVVFTQAGTTCASGDVTFRDEAIS